jgi:copper(I)-binding protein
MKRITTIAAVLVAAASLGLAACGDDDDAGTTAASTTAEAVSVSGPWARVTAPEAKTSAAYMTITSKDGDVLTNASVPADIAGMAQLHETTTSGESMDSMDGESMSAMKGMKEVEQIDIPAGGSVQLKPGGYHIMLMELAAPIAAGDTVPVTLTFEKAGEVTVDAVAKES